MTTPESLGVVPKMVERLVSVGSTLEESGTNKSLLIYAIKQSLLRSTYEPKMTALPPARTTR